MDGESVVEEATTDMDGESVVEDVPVPVLVLAPAPARAADGRDAAKKIPPRSAARMTLPHPTHLLNPPLRRTGNEVPYDTI